MKAPRIILADAHLMVLDTMKDFLAKEFDVVGTFTDGNTLVKCAPDLKPDVIVLDISMPLMNGLIAGERLKQVLPKVKLVYLTMNLEPHTALEAFRLGASGYVAKNSAATELIKALRLALVGQSYVSDLIVKDDLPGIFIERAKRLKRAGPLTKRQEEVLQLLAEGRSMKEAAHILNVSPRTVAFHKYSIMEHLHFRNNADLVRFAMRTPLLGGITGLLAEG
jgi:DNA-binding NarL/FixJ family response regulator